jgi:hypothetical protein
MLKTLDCIETSSLGFREVLGQFTLPKKLPLKILLRLLEYIKKQTTILLEILSTVLPF